MVSDFHSPEPARAVALVNCADGPGCHDNLTQHLHTDWTFMSNPAMKVAVVTGSGRGIGLDHALNRTYVGARVVVHGNW